MFTTAVVPLDGSQLAARALPFARRFADAETKLVVVRAHQSLDDAPTSTARYPYLPPWERTRLERKMARAHFAADLEGLARQGLHVEP
jgi:nucleotide-binding universal stress UspA family protein